MTAKLMNDICRCTGETEMDDEAKVCPARNECLRYLERETFRGRVYQYAAVLAIFANIPRAVLNKNGANPACKPRLKTNICERCGETVGSGNACSAVPENERFDLFND